MKTITNYHQKETEKNKKEDEKSQEKNKKVVCDDSFYECYATKKDSW